MPDYPKIKTLPNTADARHAALGDLGLRVFTTFRTHLITARTNYAIERDWKTEPALLRLKQHVNRVIESATTLGIIAESSSEISDTLQADVLATVRSASMQHPTQPLTIRLCLTPHGPLLHCEPLTANPRPAPIRLGTATCERILPEHKTTNAIAPLLALRQARSSGFDEVLLVNRAGLITETAWANFFWLNARRELCTTRTQALPGITQSDIIEHEDVSVRPLSLKNLHDEVVEAFVTQSTSGIVPVTQLEHRELSSDAVTEIQKRYAARVEKYAEPICRAWHAGDAP